MQQVRLDETASIVVGVAGGGMGRNMQPDYRRLATWKTDDDQRPLLTVEVRAFVNGVIETVGGLHLADLERGVTLARGQVVYPPGYDNRTAVVRYVPRAEKRVVHHQCGEEERALRECQSPETLRDESGGLDVVRDSLDHARRAARAFVESYVFDPAEATG